MDLGKRKFMKAGAALGLSAAFPAVAYGASEKWSPIRGRSDYIIELGSSEPLVAVNSDKPIVPASTTKLETLAIAIREAEAGNFDPKKRIKLSPNARKQPPVKSYLRWTTGEEAMNLAATCSYNDMAVAIAEEIAGTEWDFHRKFMMPLAEDLKMKNTEFWNVSGLPKPGIGENITTAEDLAKLAAYILNEYDDYFGLFGQAVYEHPKKGRLVNTNGLLENSESRSAVPTQGVDWGKTGYINKAGFQIVCSCEREERRLIVVSTGHSSAKARNEHVHNMIEQVYANLEPIEKPKPQIQTETYGCPEYDRTPCIA